MTSTKPQYRYSLDPSSKKYRCPDCGKKTFVVFLDNETGFPVDELQYGRCDRENNCGFYQSPWEDPQLASAAKAHTRYQVKEIVHIFPRQDLIDRILNRTRTCVSPLHQWLNSKGIPNDHLLKWGVYSEEEKTVYVLRNCDQRIVNFKWFKYKKDGHRDKNFNAHSIPPLKDHQGDTKIEKYKLCLYGEHLLDPEKKKIACIVESEKTAVVASYFYPEYDWVSCSSNNGLTHEKLLALLNRTVYWLCDADSAGRKNTSIERAARTVEQFYVCDLFPERNDSYDIADAILDGNKPDIEKSAKRFSDSYKDAAPADPWPAGLHGSFTKCVNLVEQIKERQLCIIDETNVNTVAHSLVLFGEKGKALFNQVALFQSSYDQEQLSMIWAKASSKKLYKTANAFFKLCREKGIEVKSNDDDPWEYRIKEPGKGPYEIELSEEEIQCIKDYGYLAVSNCFHFAMFNNESRICTLERRSNFTFRILFHITRGKSNKRIIELTNVHGRKVSLDIETSLLASFQKFKELTEGAGNFIFDGSNSDLSKIKNKLFSEEKASIQIDMLGWNNKAKLFAFSNGVYTDAFHAVDEHGTVSVNGTNFFIPYHPNTDEFLHMNEKKFFYKLSDTRFSTWSVLYCKAFGNAGQVALLFGIATLFSDHIYHVRGNFPLLFLYGEGGSGKSRVAMYLQHLWGDPQPPLKLSEKANTDKGKIRKMAQYTNAMACFEEFINELDMSVIKTITGIYDRFGYERSNLDSKFGTETVPINSTAIITGNVYPNDDPLMQRLILMDYNANVRDENVVSAYDELTQLNRNGLTEITGRLLQARAHVVANFERIFREEFNSLKSKLKSSSDVVAVIPDRMVENYSVILAMYQVLNGGTDFSLPFSYSNLLTFLIDTIKIQNEKRDTGSVTQRFWDIVLQLANEGVIKNRKEFRLQDNHLLIRWKEVHAAYMEKHFRVYRTQGLSSSSLMQKLKDSGAYVDYKDKVRFPEATELRASTSAHIFQYDRLGIDLVSVINYLDKEQYDKNKTYWQRRDEELARANPAEGIEPKSENSSFLSAGNEPIPTDTPQIYFSSLQSAKNVNVENSSKNDDLPF